MTPREMTLLEIDRIVADLGYSHREILQRWGYGGRCPKLLEARKHCAATLMQNGRTLTETARAMARDHSTIRYYLGRVCK